MFTFELIIPPRLGIGIFDHGQGDGFNNVYPLRYPGTWDADTAAREKAGPEKWAKAGDAFVEELQAAVLGRKPVAQAMEDVAKRVKPLLP